LTHKIKLNYYSFKEYGRQQKRLWETTKKIMGDNKKEETTGSKGFGHHVAQGLARCGERGIAGATSPSSSVCYKIGTWNVRSLSQPGKMAGIFQEMERMNVDIMGVSETCWKDEGDFKSGLPGMEDIYRVIYSGGEKNRKGVGVILRGDVERSVLNYNLISDRIITVKLKATPVNLLLIQVYAPCEDAEEEEKERFYEQIDQVITENRKGRECLIVMGDFNGKVGRNKEEDTVGPYGVGIRNENGQHIVELCKRHNLYVTNTWFQQKPSAQHTWTSPDGKTKKSNRLHSFR